MKPINQTRFGTDGDCFAACVASLLHLEIGEVPAFDQPDEDLWWSRFREWLGPRGFSAVLLAREPLELRGCWCLAGGDGPRGLKHEVVWRNGEMQHDPHPSKDGLVKAEDFIYLVPLDPASLRPARCWRHAVGSGDGE